MSKRRSDDGWWVIFFAGLSVTSLITAFTIELPGLNFAALILACLLALPAVYFFDRWKKAKKPTKIRKKRRNDMRKRLPIIVTFVIFVGGTILTHYNNILGLLLMLADFLFVLTWVFWPDIRNRFKKP